MRKLTLVLPMAFVALLYVAALAPHHVGAQGKAAQDWPTANATPQRDAWVRTDFQISPENMAKTTGFGVVRKVQLGGDTRQMPLPAFHLLSSTAGGYGFKSLGYIVDASGNALGIDSDMPNPNLIYWRTRVSPALAGECSGVLSAGAAYTTTLTLGAPAPNRFTPPDTSAIPAGFPQRGVSGGIVGNPDEGAPSIKYFGPGLIGTNAAIQAAGGGAIRLPVPPPPAGDRVDFPVPLPIPFPKVVSGPPAAGAGGGRGAATPGVFVLSADGSVRSLSRQMGYDVWMGPARFLPANSNAFGLLAIQSSGAPILYVATSNGCGGTPGVWALDLATPERTVTSWKTNGGTVAGTVGAAFGTDGTVYAATGDGEYAPGSYSDSVVALEGKTLAMKDFFTPGKTEFVSSPVVINRNRKDLIAVANKDGRMYLLDSAALGGADHKTPLSVSAKYANIGTELPGALASWEDTDGTRWVLTSVAGALASTAGFQTNGNVSNGAIVAFKIIDQGGKPALQPGWVSHDIASPLPPIVVNGVVFAAGRGAQGNAVLYALDGGTGREYVNTPLTGGPPKGALSAQFATVYVQTSDNTLWSLGFPQDKEDFGAVFGSTK